MESVFTILNRVRSVLPQCGEEDERASFARQANRTGQETEMAAMGGKIGGSGEFGTGEGGMERQTSFGGEGGEYQGSKMNGSLTGLDQEGEGAEIGEVSEFSSKEKISEWQAGWNVTNAIQALFTFNSSNPMVQELQQHVPMLPQAAKYVVLCWISGLGITENEVADWAAKEGMFIVSLPYAVKNGGYWGVFAMVFVAYICCHTGKILVQCLYEVNERGEKVRVRDSYVSIAQCVMGKSYGGKLVNCAQIIELMMTCILYIVLCGDLLAGMFPTGSLDSQAWMMVAGMLLLPCAFLKTLHSVSFLSFWCSMVHLAINIIIIGYCLTQAGSWYWNKVEVNIDVYHFPISLGIVVFSYTSQIFLPSLEGCLKDRSRFNCMLNWSHIAAAIFKATFAYVCFLTWGDLTQEEITINLPSRGFRGLINFILVIKALLSYPLPYYATVDLLSTAFFRGAPQTKFPSCYALDGELKVWGLGLRIFIVLITVGIAVSVPHFAILMGLIGSFTGTMLSLIWPSVFHLKIKGSYLGLHVICFDVFIICLGVFCGINGIYYSFRALIKAYQIKLPA